MNEPYARPCHGTSVVTRVPIGDFSLAALIGVLS